MENVLTVNTIQIKRGLSANLAGLELKQGEPAFTTDTKKLYVGNVAGEKILINPDVILDADKPVSNPQKDYIDSQDTLTLNSANNYTDTHNTDSTAHTDIRNILKNAVNIPVWDNTDYTLKFTTLDGSILEIDLPIESLAKNIDYDSSTKEIILIKQDDTQIRVSIADLIDVYVGHDGTHIQTSIENGNVIKSTLKAGSITEADLAPELIEKLSVIDGGTF